MHYSRTLVIQNLTLNHVCYLLRLWRTITSCSSLKRKLEALIRKRSLLLLFDLFRQKGLNVPTDNSFDLLNVKSRAVDFILRSAQFEDVPTPTEMRTDDIQALTISICGMSSVVVDPNDEEEKTSV